MRAGYCPDVNDAAGDYKSIRYIPELPPSLQHGWQNYNDVSIHFLSFPKNFPSARCHSNFPFATSMLACQIDQPIFDSRGHSIDSRDRNDESIRAGDVCFLQHATLSVDDFPDQEI